MRWKTLVWKDYSWEVHRAGTASFDHRTDDLQDLPNLWPTVDEIADEHGLAPRMGGSSMCVQMDLKRALHCVGLCGGFDVIERG
jgi:hypothetical protein